MLNKAKSVRLIGAPAPTDTYDDKRPAVYGLEIAATCPVCGVEDRRRVDYNDNLLDNYHEINRPTRVAFICSTPGCEPSPEATGGESWGGDRAAFAADVMLLYTLAIPGDDDAWRLAPPEGTRFAGAVLAADDARLLPGDLIVRGAVNGHLVIEIGESGEWRSHVYEDDEQPGAALLRLLRQHLHDELRSKHRGGLDVTQHDDGWAT